MKPKVFVLVGKKQSGKDTTYDYMAKELGDYACTQVMFAGPLKDFCKEWFGLTHDQCYGTDYDKNTLTGLAHPDEGGRHMTAREVLQYVGTDMMRKLDPNIWVKRCWASVDNALSKPDVKHVFVTDCRFPNELSSSIDREDTIVIKLKRKNYKHRDEHISETALDDVEDSSYDFVIEAANVEEIKEQCLNILQGL